MRIRTILQLILLICNDRLSISFKAGHYFSTTPGENVFKAIKRLGGSSKGKTSSADRWKKKKTAEAAKNEGESSDGAAAQDSTSSSTAEPGSETASKDSMLRLTALADQLLQSGDLGVYESTVEKLKHELERNRPPVPATAAARSREADDDDDALDMFADEIDAEKLSKSDGGGTSNGATATNGAESTNGASNAAAPVGVAQDFSHEVHWWYRWEKSHAAEEHGPFPSTQMKTWTELGYFPNGVWLRKDSQEVRDDLENLYNSERIDFELYT